MITDLLADLQALCALDAPSGREGAVRDYLLSRLEESPVSKEYLASPTGNLIVRLRGRQPAARTVVFDAHMDEVGLIITYIHPDGSASFACVGGISDAVLFGARVRVGEHVGVIAGKPIHLCQGDEKDKIPAAADMRIDFGTASREETEQFLRPGDTAVFASEWTPLGAGRYQSKAVDDRFGCAILLELARTVPPADLVLSFSVQEEVGCRGAKTVAGALSPDVAVVLDATTASDTAGVSGADRVCCLGAGPVVSFMDRATLYDRELYEQVRQLAADKGLPSQTKTRIAGGNNASAYQHTGAGCRVTAISLPCRYIHSAASVFESADVEATASLISALAETLPL